VNAPRQTADPAEQVRDAVEAVGMSKTISFEEHQAWMKLARVGTHASFARLARMVR
jgi:hypothetical protein